jgi:hypothetical protein
MDYSGIQVYMTTPGLLAISDLLVQAPVPGLLHSKIQRQRLVTDLGLLRASRTLAAVYKTMFSKIQSIRLLMDLQL